MIIMLQKVPTYQRKFIIGPLNFSVKKEVVTATITTNTDKKAPDIFNSLSVTNDTKVLAPPLFKLKKYTCNSLIN